MRPVLFDEMYEGYSEELRKRGYEAESVRELKSRGLLVHYDHSIIKYVTEKKMILLTRDKENIGGCKENNIPCIELGENPSLDDIIAKLKESENLS